MEVDQWTRRPEERHIKLGGEAGWMIVDSLDARRMQVRVGIHSEPAVCVAKSQITAAYWWQLHHHSQDGPFWLG